MMEVVSTRLSAGHTRSTLSRDSVSASMMVFKKPSQEMLQGGRRSPGNHMQHTKRSSLRTRYTARPCIQYPQQPTAPSFMRARMRAR
jgi:hypothetical protein